MIEKLRNMNIQYLHNIHFDVIFDLQIPNLLADYYISLSEHFSKELVDKSFKYHSVPSSEKVVSILRQLKDSTKAIPVSRFIQSVEKIIVNLKSSGISITLR